MTPSLHLEQVHHGFGRQAVLQGIDLMLEPGQFTAVIGPNGAGKTTLLQCLTGVLRPTSGRVLIAGTDLAETPVAAKQKLGVAVDPHRLPPLLSGRECLRLYAGARGLPSVPASTFALCDALALTPMLDRQIDRCSFGTRQKIGVALGLLGEPPLLVLDEPLNGLDPLSAFALKQHLRGLCHEQGATVLLATHSLDVAERFISRALLLVDGRIRHNWNDADLQAIRENPDRSLEQSMVEAMQEASRRPDFETLA